jgi:hypothetical protein
MSEESQNITGHRKALGVGLGAGLLGAVALAMRYGWRKTLRGIIPDAISPADVKAAREKFKDINAPLPRAGYEKKAAKLEADAKAASAQPPAPK